MRSTPDSVTISKSTSLKDFFRTELTQVVEDHHVEVGEDTLWYLTQLLYNYRRSDHFFDYKQDGGTLTPLAEYYRQAIEAPSDQERRLHLQRLGDVSIFISSLFSGALKRKSVNVEYYMSMGESAYSTLADSAGNSTRDRALSDIFAELSKSFYELATAMADIARQSREEQSVQELFVEWEKTRSPALAKRLEERGVLLSLASHISH